jgi:uncharacterized membrane protein
MTPKEKAKELVHNFYPNVQWKLGQEDCLKRAKNCALIAVDEMLSEHFGDITEYAMRRYNYLTDVKQEIELL